MKIETADEIHNFHKAKIHNREIHNGSRFYKIFENINL